MLTQAGFLGTNASLGADLTLIAEIILYIALIAGVVAQRRGRYQLHDRIQTPVVIINFFFILFFMVRSFLNNQVATAFPQRPFDPYYLLVVIHAALGMITAVLALYCLLAGHKILPRKIGRLRYWMWTTFAFWTATVVFGVLMYYVWYVQPAAGEQGSRGAEENPQSAIADPQSQRVLLQGFAFSPPEMTVVVGTEVTWLNQDGAPHNITFVDGSNTSENFFQGETFTVDFDTPGSFAIYCSLHGSPDGSGMAGVVNVVEATTENVEQVAQEAAAAPTPNPIPPTPTPVPAVPPPPVEPLEPPAPEQRIVGLVSFFDTLAPSDSLNILLNGLADPGGIELHGWLTDSGTGSVLALGRLQPDANGNLNTVYNDPEHRNLLALYDGFQITEEPPFDDDPTLGPVVYSGQQATEALGVIRTITVGAAEPPGGTAYALGARLQTEELLRHVEYVQIAFELLSIADAKRHSEHILNLLDGTGSDLDGAHGVQNPGDGFGIIPYVARMREAAEAASVAADATGAIQLHASHVVLSSDNALNWANQVREAVVQIGQTASVGDIGLQVETITRFGNLLLNGEDGNGDGEVAPAEGGIFTAYQHAQYMAAIGVSTGAEGQGSGGAEEHDHAAAATPQSEISDPQSADPQSEIVIRMLDFSFEPAEVSVAVGTTVRFVNAGQARHSATLDSAAFDSTLLEPGGEFSFTFTEAGTFPFYCTLHGLPGGEGMSGVIIVNP